MWNDGRGGWVEADLFTGQRAAVVLEHHVRAFPAATTTAVMRTDASERCAFTSPPVSVRSSPIIATAPAEAVVYRVERVMSVMEVWQQSKNSCLNAVPEWAFRLTDPR